MVLRSGLASLSLLRKPSRKTQATRRTKRQARDCASSLRLGNELRLAPANAYCKAEHADPRPQVRYGFQWGVSISDFQRAISVPKRLGREGNKDCLSNEANNKTPSIVWCETEQRQRISMLNKTLHISLRYRSHPLSIATLC